MADKWEDDEYVANLLKQDAKKAAKTYELVGIDAFKHQKRAGVPKPNTNFLRHIIRQTDSHNAALLAKEAEESRARFREFDRERDRGRRRRDYSPKHKRDGRLTPVPSEHDLSESFSERNGKHDISSRRRARDHPEPGTHESRRHRSRERRRDQKRHHSSDEERSDRKRRHKHDRDEHSQRTRKSRYRDHRRGRGKSTSRSPSISRSHRSHKERDRNKRRDRSITPQRTRRDSRSGSVSSVSVKTSRKIRRRSASIHSDSDPLEALVGPLPPAQASTVQPRGRGAQKVNTTNMDSRFTENYDPTTDVRIESDAEDDWGDALESLRDRQRWKQQGASRLKAAGFTDTQIQKWEKGSQPTEDDVVWTEKGQAREWDRGKVVSKDGDIELKADFGPEIK